MDVVRDGEIVFERQEMVQMRLWRVADLARLDPGVTRLVNPHVYHVSVSETLWQLKKDLIEKYKNTDEAELI